LKGILRRCHDPEAFDEIGQRRARLVFLIEHWLPL
jgi:hypothetical protein